MKEVYFKKEEELTPELIYKPERDIPNAVRILQTDSPKLISEWLLIRFNHVIIPDKVASWFYRHPEIKEELKKEMELRKEIMKEKVYPEINLFKQLISCNSCSFAKEVIEDESIRKTFCIKVNKLIKFRKICVNYKAVSCITCLYLIELIYVDEIFLKKGSSRHSRYDVWSIKCEKEGLMKNIRIKSNDTERVLPNCSLWKLK